MIRFRIQIFFIVILLIINLGLISNINADISINSSNILLDASSESFNNINNENETIHRFCFVESGDVNHEVLNFRGFFIPGPPAFGIGSVYAELLGWRGDTRLRVRDLFSTTLYNQDVCVTVKVFIGYAYPSVSVHGGILKGFSLVASVTPL